MPPPCLAAEQGSLSERLPQGLLPCRVLRGQSEGVLDFLGLALVAHGATETARLAQRLQKLFRLVAQVLVATC